MHKVSELFKSSIYHSLQISWAWALLVFTYRCFRGLYLRCLTQELGYKPFSPQEEVSGLRFPPDYGFCCCGWGLWLDCVSAFPTYFNVVSSLSFVWCEEVALTVLVFVLFCFFSEEVVLYIAVGSVRPWEKMSSGYSHITISNQILNGSINSRVSTQGQKQMRTEIYNHLYDKGVLQCSEERMVFQEALQRRWEPWRWRV